MTQTDAVRTIGFIEGLMKAAEIVQKNIKTSCDPRSIYAILDSLRNEVQTLQREIERKDDEEADPIRG